MKNVIKISMIAVIAVVVTLASCNKADDTNPNLTTGLTGTYDGTLITNNLKGTSPAKADITAVNDYTVEIHCYGEDIDTTIMLELYEDGDMMRVCFTDEDFYGEYGHNKSNDHHMMGDNGNWTNWGQHMSQDHGEGDEHYGYFNMADGQFNYTFNIEVSGGNTYTQEFSGTKQ
ncbi:MAG: hypothetical protein L3J31_00370 [Bacteroidales bacterium]|nr:hypothetical protein [Bacteroidales bacterium]